MHITRTSNVLGEVTFDVKFSPFFYNVWSEIAYNCLKFNIYQAQNHKGCLISSLFLSQDPSILFLLAYISIII